MNKKMTWNVGKWQVLNRKQIFIKLFVDQNKNKFAY